MAGDYGALPIDSKTGKGSPSGDIPALGSLASFGQTMLAAVRGAPDAIARDTSKGQVIKPALA